MFIIKAIRRHQTNPSREECHKSKLDHELSGVKKTAIFVLKGGYPIMHCLEHIILINDRAYEKWLEERNATRRQAFIELSEILSEMELRFKLVPPDLLLSPNKKDAKGLVKS